MNVRVLPAQSNNSAPINIDELLATARSQQGDSSETSTPSVDIEASGAPETPGGDLSSQESEESHRQPSTSKNNNDDRPQ
jgi:hypothetical protein